MAELVFVVIALFCLFINAETGVFFLAVAAAITALRRRGLASKLAEQEEKLQNALDQITELRLQLKTLRTEKAAEPRHVSVTEAEVKTATVAPAAAAHTAEPVRQPAPIAPPHIAPAPVPPAGPAAAAASAQPQAPMQPTVAPKPTEHASPEPPKPVAPPTIPAYAAPAPPKPAVPAQSPAAASTPPHPVVPPAAPAPPRVIGHISSVQPAQASHSTPPPIAPMRPTYAPGVPVEPSKPLGERLKSVLAFEEILGTSWLNRIGIVLVVLGVAWLGTVGFNRVGPLGKVLMTTAIGAALLVGGILFEKRERYQILGRAMIGGGWAVLFFAAYAAGHVDAMRVLASPVIDAIVMLIVAAAMGAHTLRYKSQLVTGLAFLLGYSTIALSHDTVYSLTAGAILAVVLVVLAVKLNWYELEVFGILSSYLNHLYWLYKIFDSIEGAHGRPFAEFLPSTIVLLLYWATFRASYIVRKIRTEHDEHVSTFAGLLNTMLLLGAMKFQSARPELAFYALLALGALEFALGQLPITKRRRTAFVMLTVMGAVLMIVAVPFRYSGSNNALLWLAGAEAFLAAGIILKEKVFRRLGVLTALIAPLPLVHQEVTTTAFFNARWNQPTVLVSYGVLFLTLGVVYYLNSQFARRRWADQFEDAIESGSMLVHSYLGAVAIVLGSWALLPMDWTILGWGALFIALVWGCSRFDASDLFLQCSVLGVITFSRAVVLNLRPDATHSHRLLTIIPLVAAFYVSARLLSRLEEEIPRAARHMFAWAGTALLTLLIWREFSWTWTVLGWAALALLLVEAARLLKYRMLFWHVHVLAALAFGRILTVNVFIAKADHWHGIPVRIFTMLAVVAVTYVLAKRVRTELQGYFAGVSGAYTWAAAAIVGTLIWLEIPEAWVAVSWMAFGLALTFIGRRLKLASLCYQENVFALAAIIATILFNYGLEKSYGHFTLRLITISLVAAGLYIGSRNSYLHSEQWKTVAYAHTWAGTGLLAALAYFEFQAGWLAMIWAAFALVLTVIDRRFKLSDLRWQAHTLSLIAAVRVVGWTLYDTSTLRGLSLRLVSLSFVVIVFYVMARVIRMPEEYRQRDVHHIYSWTASMIAMAGIWYELQAAQLSIAVVWGIFGLLLVQSGLMGKIRQLRFQGYVAVAAAFTRIFFSNLTATGPGHLRIVTVGVLALIIFYIYSQLEAHKSELVESRFRVGSLFCYAGTITIAALLYFELEAHGDWIVTAWAALVFALFAAALLLGRNTFLHQGLLLAFAVLFRGLFHNLFGGSYFNGSDWTGRYMVLGSAIALLFLTLSFAFRLRETSPPSTSEGKFRRMLSAFARHPEQVIFFLPFLLLTLMLALKLRAGMVTVSWGIEAVLIFVFALAVRERSYRLTGLLLLLVCVGKILIVDIWKFEKIDKIITFVILGLLLMAISFLYGKYREAIRQLL